MRVAVTGITGRLGREAVQILSAKGVETRCLLRHAIDSSVTPSLEKDASSAEVARFLSLLPSVTMVEGDATSAKSCIDLVKGCDAVCECSLTSSSTRNAPKLSSFGFENPKWLYMGP